MARASWRHPARLLRAGLVLPILAAWTPSAADIEPLSLFQKAARAALVARVRAASDSTRRPLLEVLQVLKGDYSRPHLIVVPFRQDYGSEKPWLRPEVFRKGREYILFLDPYRPDSEAQDFQIEAEDAASEEEGTHFVVLNANHGVLDVPAEGAGALTEAIERFAGILATPQYDQQAAAFRKLLRESNPHLVEAGLEEVWRYGIATPEDLDILADLSGSARVSFRRSAVGIMGQLAAEARRTRNPLPRGEWVFDRIAARALADNSPEVRAEAARAIGQFEGQAAVELLRRIGRDDPHQDVRYSAEVALSGMAGEREP